MQLKECTRWLYFSYGRSMWNMQILSNMGCSLLVIHGVRFHSAEQAYQVAKATYAGNRYLMNCIMNACSPFECKRLRWTMHWEISVE